MAKKIYPDSDLKNADWAKRTPDRIEDIEANIKKKGATDMGKASESQLANKKSPEDEWWEQEMREKEEWSNLVARSGKQVGTAVKPPALKKDGSLKDPNPKKEDKGKAPAANQESERPVDSKTHSGLTTTNVNDVSAAISRALVKALGLDNQGK